MSEQDLVAVRDEALALPANEVHGPRIPVPVFMLEGDGVAAFMDYHWEPSTDGKRPGLNIAKSRVSRGDATIIRTLVGAARTANARALYPSETGTDNEALIAQADEVLLDLGAAIEFILDDDIEEPADEAWAGAKERASDDDTLATKIQALEDYAQIAEELLDRLEQLEDFKPEWVALARDLAGKLSAEGPPKAGFDASAEIDLRNRIFVLLERKIAQVRSAARYVYRRHPEVLRKVTSQYERRRRLELRRRKLREAAEAEAKAAAEAGAGQPQA